MAGDVSDAQRHPSGRSAVEAYLTAFTGLAAVVADLALLAIA